MMLMISYPYSNSSELIDFSNYYIVVIIVMEVVAIVLLFKVEIVSVLSPLTKNESDDDIFKSG